MPSSAYFLRQADICLRLSLVASDDQVSSRLVAMAQEYKTKAAALDSATGSELGMGSIAPQIADRRGAAENDTERN
jgi:hypothetical protein